MARRDLSWLCIPRTVYIIILLAILLAVGTCFQHSSPAKSLVAYHVWDKDVSATQAQLFARRAKAKGKELDAIQLVATEGAFALVIGQ